MTTHDHGWRREDIRASNIEQALEMATLIHAIMEFHVTGTGF